MLVSLLLLAVELGDLVPVLLAASLFNDGGGLIWSKVFSSLYLLAQLLLLPEELGDLILFFLVGGDIESLVGDLLLALFLPLNFILRAAKQDCRTPLSMCFKPDKSAAWSIKCWPSSSIFSESRRFCGGLILSDGGRNGFGPALFSSSDPPATGFLATSFPVDAEKGDASLNRGFLSNSF